MEYRLLEVTLISAEDLKDVKLFGKMKTYVVAWVDPSRKASTNLDRSGGGKNPKWGDKLTLSVDEKLLQQGNSMLVLEIYSSSSVGGSTLVGRVNVPLGDILVKGATDTPVSYQVRRPSGRFQGIMHLNVKLGEKQQSPYKEEPQTAYPYPPAQGVPAYPPQQQGYQGYPPQQGQYPPYQQGYPPGQQYYQPAPSYMSQPGRPPRFGGGRMGGGMGGMGLGLGAGLLGGLLVGDMIDDIGDHDYGGGYDGGDYGGDFGGDW